MSNCYTSIQTTHRLNMSTTDLNGGCRCGRSWPNGEILSSMALLCFCW